ncbi:MAG: hypothetical protein ACI8XB_000633, partial [Patiriisocius sp.]
NYNLHISKVIDKRENKGNIGSYKKNGVLKNSVKVSFPFDIQTYLLDCLHQVSHPKVINDDSFILLIHKFKMYSKTFSSVEVALFDIEIEFAKETDSLLQSYGIFESRTMENLMIIARSYARSQQIELAIENCFTSFEESNFLVNNLQPVVLESRRNYNFKPKSIMKKGLYFSYGNFINGNNLKDASFRFEQRNQSNKNRIFQLNSPAVEDPGRVRFVSNGENIFMNLQGSLYGNYFVPALEVGRFLYFEHKLNLPSEAYFGVPGASMSTSRKAIIFDTQTGKSMPFNDFNIYTIVKDHERILIEYKKSKRKLADARIAIAALNKKLNETTEFE